MTTDKTMQVEDTLRKIAGKILRNDKIDLCPNTTFKELGADSLDVVQIMVGIEEAFDIELLDDEMKSINNMGGFIGYIKKKVAEKK
jgi:acyl carrier protein